MGKNNKIPEQIKAEIKERYISSGRSAYSIATEYGISRTTVTRWIKAENWGAERKDYREQVVTELSERCSSDAEYFGTLNKAGDLLFAKVIQILSLEEALAPRDLKSISSTLLDLKLLRSDDRPDTKQMQQALEVQFVDMGFDYGTEDSKAQ